MEECIPTRRHSRDYLVKFPEELLVGNLGNHMLFAAEVSPRILSQGGQWVAQASDGQDGAPHLTLTVG